MRTVDTVLDAFVGSILEVVSTTAAAGSATVPGSPPTAPLFRADIRRVGIAALEMEAGVLRAADWRDARAALQTDVLRVPMAFHTCIARARLLMEVYMGLVRGKGVAVVRWRCVRGFDSVCPSDCAGAASHPRAGQAPVGARIGDSAFLA